MKNPNTINIHGKDYFTVAGRVQLAHEKLTELSIHTEIISHDPIVFRAVVSCPKGTFVGTSSVSLTTAKTIEKQSPYEVAETSAVGRALGFAGFGSEDGIATAEEVQKAEAAGKIPQADEPLSPRQMAEKLEQPKKVVHTEVTQTPLISSYSTETTAQLRLLVSNLIRQGRARKTDGSLLTFMEANSLERPDLVAVIEGAEQA